MAEAKVWTVWTRDPWTGLDLECVVATTRRADLHAVLVRCGLRRRDAVIYRRKSGEDGSAHVLVDSATLLAGDGGPGLWTDEQALADAREQYAQRRPQGWRRPRPRPDGQRAPSRPMILGPRSRSG